jgi:hypothetical protein
MLALAGLWYFKARIEFSKAALKRFNQLLSRFFNGIGLKQSLGRVWTCVRSISVRRKSSLYSFPSSSRGPTRWSQDSQWGLRAREARGLNLCRYV